jgi:hypothetical protein
MAYIFLAICAAAVVAFVFWCITTALWLGAGIGVVSLILLAFFYITIHNNHAKLK